MDKTEIGHHISKKYNAELEALRSRVLEMGGIIEQQINDSITALSDGDTELADHVITEDYNAH